MNSQTLLRKETLRLLTHRRKVDPKYSKKHLADDLGIHHISLYQFLNGKRSLKRKTARKYFVPQLPEETWTKIEKEYLREETASQHVEGVRLFETNEDYPRQTADQYALNSDPLSWALLYLLDVEDYRPKIEWKAQKLRLTPPEVQERLDRLERLGLIERLSPGGGYRRCDKVIETTDAKANLSIREHRQKLFPMMYRALDLDQSEQDFYHWVFAMDPQDVQKFRKVIRKFFKQIEKEQFCSRPKRVYAFLTGLFPLTD